MFAVMRAGVLVAPALISISFGFSHGVSGGLSDDYGGNGTSAEEVLVPIDTHAFGDFSLTDNVTQNNRGGLDA